MPVLRSSNGQTEAQNQKKHIKSKVIRKLPETLSPHAEDRAGERVSAPNGNCTVRALNKVNLHPDKLALWSTKEGVLSFGQLGGLAGAFQSKFMSQGLKCGDAVVVMALPSQQLFGALLALMGLGCPVVFIEPWMPAGHISSVLALTGARAFFGDTFGNFWRLRCAHLRSLPRIGTFDDISRNGGFELAVAGVDANQAAIISFTSGTTGQPKGVVRTHAYLWELHEILVKYGKDEALDGPDLTIFPNLVLYHIGTGRGSVLVPRNWSFTSLRRIVEMEKQLCPLSLSCGPAFLSRLVENNLLPQSLRQVHVGGALVECSLLEKTLKNLPKASVHVVYGGTEVEPVSVCDAAASIENSRRKGYLHAVNVGFPVTEIKTKWDDMGILWVSGPNVCSEYLAGQDDNLRNKQRDPDGTLWHRTGDRILSDEQGLWFAGRSSQSHDDFLFEQKMYAKIGHTSAFLHRDDAQGVHVVADDSPVRVESVVRDLGLAKFRVWSGRIVRDRRHRSRIDRQSSWERSLRMQRWWTYLKERSPLFILLILSTGPLVSGFFLSQVHGNCEASGSQSCIRNSPRAELTFLAILSSMTFMILARMMDELKDFAKDKIANPLRPLPRGLISPSEMSRAVVLVFGILLAFSGLILFWGSALSSILLGFSVLYLWLMYKEFYVASRLAEFPIIYALSHQFVGVPLYLFGVTLYAPDFSQSGWAWLYVGSNVAASLTYEFARKLRPDAHTAAATYRQIYGLKKAAALTLFFQITALLFSVQALSGGFQGAAILLALQLCVIVVLCVVTAKDSHHKAAEGLAALGVLASAWMGLFVFFKF